MTSLKHYCGGVRARLAQDVAIAAPTREDCSHQGQTWMFLGCSLSFCGSDVRVPGARVDAQHPVVAAPPASTSPCALAAGTDQRSRRAMLRPLPLEVATVRCLLWL